MKSDKEIYFISFILKYLFFIFQFFNDFISDNDEHPQNIPEKLFPFETYQFSNAYTSDIDSHLSNIA